MWWYNTGSIEPSHGTLANNVASGPWIGPTAGACDPNTNYSSGSGGQPQLYRGVLLFSDLPEPLNTTCKPERDGLMQAWTSTDTSVGTGDELNAMFCYMQTFCERDDKEPEPPVQPICINPALSSVSVGPQAAPGQTITITANINPTIDYRLSVKDPEGNIRGFPTQATGNQWSYVFPMANACQDGTYTICVIPTDTRCPEWSNAASFQVTGCGNIVSCKVSVDGATMTGQTTGSQPPGSMQIVTLPSDQCNCPGYEFVLRDATNYVIGQPRIQGATRVDSHTIKWQIPIAASKEHEYTVIPSCCSTSELSNNLLTRQAA